MDDLSLALNNSGIGGYLRDAFLNHLCYNENNSFLKIILFRYLYE